MSQVTFIIYSIFPPTKNRIGLIPFAKKTLTRLRISKKSSKFAAQILKTYQVL